MATAIVIAVAAGAGAWGLGVTAMTAVAIGLAATSLYVGVEASQMAKGSAPTQAERKQLVRSGVAPKQVIFGETLVSAVWLFAEEQQGGQSTDGYYKEWLYNAFGVAGHECESIDTLYFNETPVDDFDSYANYQIHNCDTSTDSYLLERRHGG